MDHPVLQIENSGSRVIPLNLNCCREGIRNSFPARSLQNGVVIPHQR
jgi:hypothetical protein